MGEVAYSFKYGDGAALLAHDCIKRLSAFLIDELINQQFTAQWPIDAVVVAGILLPRLHALTVLVPEIIAELACAAVE